VKQARLVVLLAIAAGLGVLRWGIPTADPGSPHAEVVSAVDRRPSAIPEQEAAAPVVVASAEIDVAGNAFSARVPLSPPAPLPPPPLLEKPFVGPPEPPPYVPPPPPPPPPIHVLGTWDDGKAPGVFIASPQGGTVLARVGTVLLADYKMSAMSSQHVTFTHISSKHEWRLPIPNAGSRP
jgi:hypothetical protein